MDVNRSISVGRLHGLQQRCANHADKLEVLAQMQVYLTIFLPPLPSSIIAINNGFSYSNRNPQNLFRTRAILCVLRIRSILSTALGYPNSRLADLGYEPSLGLDGLVAFCDTKILPS